MADERRPPRRRGKRRRNILASIITFFFICGALLLGVSVFFKISVIRVEGNTRYTQDQVVAASGIKKGDNLFFVNKFDAISKIFSELPYAEKITMKRDLPNIIVISVTDASPAAYIQTGESFWLMDKSCKLLEKAGEDKISGLISITGVNLSNPETGKKLRLTESGKESYLVSVITELGNRQMLKNITKIDFTNPIDGKFDYLGRFIVKLGKNDNIPGKIGMMKEALDSKRISSVASGTIDLSQDKEVRFIPD